VRFLLSRRWIGFGLGVVVLAVGCYWLGVWQFHRLHDREATNAQTRHNLAAAPVPVQQVMSTAHGPAGAEEWRRVTATGRYLQDESVVVRYQTRNGSSGVDVVTPLETAGGTAVLVDRGWLPTTNTGTRPRLPAAPSGDVTVVGWLRVDATGSSTAVDARSTRAISSAAIAPTVSVPVYRGFVDAVKESPAAAHPLVPVEQPDLGNGPHLFYGIQWWFFAALAVFGFFYFAWDERRKRSGAAPQSARSMPPSTGTIAPVTNEADGESRKAATAPNSSGRP
jgi:cytochrome oxidase assembly protein ShyY1